MKKILLSVFAVSTMLSGVSADGMPEKKSRSSDTGFRFEVGVLGGGSVVERKYSLRDLDENTPDGGQKLASLGGHGGGFGLAGYKFGNGMLVGVQAQGGIANDLAKKHTNFESGGAVRHVRLKRDTTYAGSVVVGKEVGTVLPYVKLGWRHSGYKWRVDDISSGNTEKGSFNTGGVMAGFGVQMDFSKGVVAGFEMDFSQGKTNTHRTPVKGTLLDAEIKDRPSVLQFAFKLGYRF